MTDTQRQLIATAVVVAIVAVIGIFAWTLPHVGVPLVIALATLVFGAYVGDKMRVEPQFAFVLLLVIAVALTVVSAAPWAVGLAFVGVAGLAGGILSGASS